MSALEVDVQEPEAPATTSLHLRNLFMKSGLSIRRSPLVIDLCTGIDEYFQQASNWENRKSSIHAG